MGCLKNDLPFTNLIDNTSEAEGIIINLMNYLKINILPAKTNIDFQFYDNFEDLYQDFLDGKLHVIAPVYRDLNYAENNGTVLSEKFSSVIIAYVYRNLPDTKRAQIIAIPQNTRIPSYAEQNFPQAHIITYNSIEDCINAVINGDADGMIANIYKIRSILNKIRNYRMLKYIELPVYCDISFLTQKKDKPLISLINKMLMDIPAESITTYTEYYAVKEQGYTRKNFLDDYLSYLIVFSIIFVIMLISLVYALQRIKEYIEFDTLTRLLNRHNLEPIVRKVLRRAEEKHEPFSLFLLDLDDFKILNDTYGHAFGDKVLQSVAKAITTNITEQDYAFRWGGEEFLIIYKGDKETSIKAAERIRKAVEQLKLTDTKSNKTEIRLTVTIGFAAYEDGQTYRGMFQIADDNLYKGKRSGKNQVV